MTTRSTVRRPMAAGPAPQGLRGAASLRGYIAPGWRRVAVLGVIAGLGLVVLASGAQPARVSADAPAASASPAAAATAASTPAATEASTPAATATATEAVVSPSGAMIDAGFGGLDLIDLTTKSVIVLGLLFVTLKVLGRMQSTGPKRGGRLQVLESRPLAQKASLHLVAVGERRLVVGLTPNGMVSLAELKADELDTADFATELAAQQAAAQGDRALVPGKPLIAPNSLMAAVVAPIDAFAGRIASVLGAVRAR
jgi:flagellar biosynthetic protein FliO